MNKKILIGSIFILTLILVMPSISAIQHNIVNDEIKHDYGKFNIKDIYSYKFPILFLFILGLYQFRWTRSDILVELATTPDPFPPGYVVAKPLLFFRAMMLFLTATLRFDFWILLSDYLGWGWLE